MTMIKKYSLIALEKLINQALALDENVATRMEKLQGKTLKIIIEPIQLELCMSFTSNQIKLMSECETPDTTIHSKPLSLIKMGLLPSSQIHALFQDKIHLSGDAELGQNVKKLFEELDIDWETQLAKLTGDAIAFKLGDVFRQGMAWQQQISSSLHASISDYIHEEVRAFPPREEVNDFFNAIDELSMDIERLEAKINLLMAKQ